MITSRLAYSSIFSQKMEMNIIMEDASSFRCGCVVHYYCLLCISIHRGYESNFTEGEWFSPDCLREGRVPKLAGLPMPWENGSFHIILLKTQTFFMLNKCFQKIKIRPIRSSGSHQWHM